MAELIARGMSNRAAAAELFVTVRTIESMLTRMYAKLGVRSRTQLASYLRDHAGHPASRSAPPLSCPTPVHRSGTLTRK